jgi:hypothetical protein
MKRKVSIFFSNCKLLSKKDDFCSRILGIQKKLLPLPRKTIMVAS